MPKKKIFKRQFNLFIHRFTRKNNWGVRWKFGFSIIAMKTFYLSINNVLYLKKLCKPFQTYKMHFRFKPKVWIFLGGTRSLTKKAVNSRMGKGAGPYLRIVYRLAGGCSLISCLGVDKVLGYRLQNKLSTRTNTRLTILHL